MHRKSERKGDIEEKENLQKDFKWEENDRNLETGWC